MVGRSCDAATLVYYDTTSQNYAFRTEYYVDGIWDWELDCYVKNRWDEDYYRWTKNGFEEYFRIKGRNNDPSYFLNWEEISEYSGKKYKEGIICAEAEEYYDSSDPHNLEKGDDVIFYSHNLEEGNDIIAYYNDFIKDIEDAVNTINKDLGVDEGRFYPGNEIKKYVRYDRFTYNKDRSLLRVLGENDYPRDLYEPSQWIANDYEIPTYYFDTNNRNIFYSCNWIYEYGPYEDISMNWEIEHGFGEYSI